MSEGHRQDSPLLCVALVATSAVIWCAVWLLNKYVMAATHVAPGIDLVFLPAGFRLLLVVVFGLWGAIGIAIADPFMFLVEFHQGSLGEVMVNALIAGFAPYLTVRAFYRIVGIQGSLVQLKPIHLPLLALAVSVVTPLLFNLHFVISGREPASEFLPHFTAMMTGDFLGCLLVSVLARVGLVVSRAALQRSR